MTTPTPRPTPEQVEAALDTLSSTVSQVSMLNSARDPYSDSDPRLRQAVKILRQALADRDQLAAEVERLRGVIKNTAHELREEGAGRWREPISESFNYYAKNLEYALDAPTGGEG